MTLHFGFLRYRKDTRDELLMHNIIIELHVKSRLFIDRFFKEIRVVFLPLLQGFNRCYVPQVTLRDMVVVDAAVLVKSVA